MSNDRLTPEQREANVRLLAFYLISIFLPVIFVIGLGIYFQSVGVNNAETEFPAVPFFAIYSIALYLNFLIVRKLPYRYVHFGISVLIPIVTFFFFSNVLMG